MKIKVVVHSEAVVEYVACVQICRQLTLGVPSVGLYWTRSLSPGWSGHWWAAVHLSLPALSPGVIDVCTASAFSIGESWVFMLLCEPLYQNIFQSLIQNTQHYIWHLYSSKEFSHLVHLLWLLLCPWRSTWQTLRAEGKWNIIKIKHLSPIYKIVIKGRISYNLAFSSLWSFIFKVIQKKSKRFPSQKMI